MRVSGLFLYPVKSLRGTPVDEVVVEPRGFRGDRRFMIVRSDGGFVTQREKPAMARVSARIDGEALVLRGDGEVRVPAAADGEPIEVRVWGDTVAARKVSLEADAWLGRALGEPVHLVGMPEESHRPVDPEYNRGADIVSFADGFPVLVLGEASLADLNSRLASGVSMERFRPNLTVDGASPYGEDAWARIGVGDGAFVATKRCSRCSMTTVDPDTGEPGKEPLATLATYRKVNGQVLMGVNLVPEGPRPWTIRVGDPVAATIGTPDLEKEHDG